MSYRRDRTIRELYEKFMDRTGSYQRVVNIVDRQPAFSCTDDVYDRGSDYEYSRGRDGYHGDDQRGYHRERTLLSGQRRSGSLYRKGNPYSYYRESAEEPSAARHAELRSSGRVSSQTNIRGQMLPPPRSLSMNVCHRGDDCVSRTNTSPDRGEEREGLKRKASFLPVHEHSPMKKEVLPAPHTHCSRSFSPDSGKATHPHLSHPKKSPFAQGSQEKESTPIYCLGEARGASPQVSPSAVKDEMPGLKVEQGEDKMKEDPGQSPEAHRAHAIANKALEIEKLYRQDCETFGMVVKMLLAKQPTLEKQLQAALKENLIDIKHRCLEDLRHFISEVDAVLKSDQSS